MKQADNNNKHKHLTSNINEKVSLLIVNAFYTINCSVSSMPISMISDCPSPLLSPHSLLSIDGSTSFAALYKIPENSLNNSALPPCVSKPSLLSPSLDTSEPLNEAFAIPLFHVQHESKVPMFHFQVNFSNSMQCL